MKPTFSSSRNAVAVNGRPMELPHTEDYFSNFTTASSVVQLPETCRITPDHPTAEDIKSLRLRPDECPVSSDALVLVTSSGRFE